MEGEKKKKEDQKAVRNRAGNEWNVIRTRVIGRWGFSCDLSPGPTSTGCDTAALVAEPCVLLLGTVVLNCFDNLCS